MEFSRSPEGMPTLKSCVVPSSMPADARPVEIRREFRRLLAAGAKLRPAGTARRDPEQLLRRYAPRYKVELFDTTYYLADVRQNPDIRFFVAYVRLGVRPRSVYPRTGLKLNGAF